MIATLVVAIVLAVGVFGYGYTVGYERAERRWSRAVIRVTARQAIARALRSTTDGCK